MMTKITSKLIGRESKWRIAKINLFRKTTKLITVIVLSEEYDSYYFFFHQ